MSLLLSPLREFGKKGDLLLLSLCLAASGFGLLLIFSATRYLESNRYVLVQLLAIFLGVFAYILLTFVDFQLFVEKNWKWILAFNICFILLLLTPLGTDHGMGNRNWLSIPRFPIDIQPNEVVKLPFVLLMALQFARLHEREQDVSSIPSVAQTGGHAVFMLALIAAVCGDMGMCVVYMFIYAFMAWSAGVKIRWFVLVGGGLVLAAVILWLFILPETSWWTDYRIMRFRVVFDHDLDPLGRGYQQSRSILAIGSGQIFGQGYLNGTQTQALNNDALPARHTDLIFAVCGEELGLVGCCAVLLLLTAIILRCFWVGLRAGDGFSLLVAVGVGTMLLAQTALNVSMCLYVAPVIGITLPFFSYGGSSILTMYLAVGLVSGIHARELPSWLKHGTASASSS